MAVDEIESTITLSVAGGNNIAATSDIIMAWTGRTGGGYDVISTASKTVLTSVDYGGTLYGIDAKDNNIYWGVGSGGVGYAQTSPTGLVNTGGVGPSYSPRSGGNKMTGAVCAGYFYYRSYLENGWLSRFLINSSGALTGTSSDYSGFGVATMATGITADTKDKLFTGGASTVRIINGVDATQIRAITTNIPGVTAVCPTSDGRIYVFGAANGGSTVLWSIYSQSGTLVSGPVDVSATMTPQVFMNDFCFAKSIGKKVYVGFGNPYYSNGGGYIVRVFDTTTDTMVKTIYTSGPPRGISFVGSKGYILTDTSVQIIDTGQGNSTSFFSMF